jgi:hypothetical protein
VYEEGLTFETPYALFFFFTFLTARKISIFKEILTTTLIFTTFLRQILMKNAVPDVFIFTRDTLTGFQKVAHQDFSRDSLERPALESPYTNVRTREKCPPGGVFPKYVRTRVRTVLKCPDIWCSARRFFPKKPQKKSLGQIL